MTKHSAVLKLYKVIEEYILGNDLITAIYVATFSSAATLNLRKRLVPGERPLKCELFDKAFSRASYLLV